MPIFRAYAGAESSGSWRAWSFVNGSCSEDFRRFLAKLALATLRLLQLSARSRAKRLPGEKGCGAHTDCLGFASLSLLPG